MDKDIYKEIQKLAKVKREAFHLSSIRELREVIACTKFTSGDVAEIIIAFLLGHFLNLMGDGGKVFMTADLDAAGEDFRIIRFSIPYSIQVKWNKKNDKEYAMYIRVVEMGASPKFEGTHYLPPERGRYVFPRLLMESGAYEEDELWTFDDEHPEFRALCDEAWDIIRC